FNQYKVLSAFQSERIALRHFNPTTGYGYDDDGRDALDRVFARCMGAEDALVRPQIVSGTHALALMLFGVLRPGDELLSITGKPYDTLETTIGISGDSLSSLKAMGVAYSQVELGEDGGIDVKASINAIHEKTKVVHIQRSRGYAWRRALTVAEIGRGIAAIKAAKPHVIVTVDNCYGEFTTTEEPVAAGADLMAGSLIKNPGGGIAPTGGYIAGRKDLIELVAERLTVPGIGREVGSYAASYAPFYQGLFLAPHVVAGTLKGATLAARVFEKLGFDVLPRWNESREDIIQAVRFFKPEPLIAFCRSIQKASPVDSFVVPEPWDMPGYQCQVIMAAGAFVQGSSIELSADAPIAPPYTAYMQGGLTYEHVKLAVMSAVSDMAAEGSVSI
ncbi:MAG: aminotransferase class I/II-fold pyridoxal phosphate-dependent enzyme, partial [Christensenellales bacterium]